MKSRHRPKARTRPDRRPHRRGLADLQPRWPDRVAARLTVRRGGRRIRLLRRLVAIGLLLCAGAVALRPDRPAGSIEVVALGRDLPAGATVDAGDLILVRLPRVPDGALRAESAASGRTLTAAARRGEVLTDVRLVSAAGLDPGPGRVAVPVPLAASAALPLLGPGMHVTVSAVHDDGSTAALTEDAVVLSVPAAGTGPQAAPKVVVLAVPRAEADRLAAGAVRDTLAVRFT